MHHYARLTPTGRPITIERIAAGTPWTQFEAQMLASRATVSKWWDRQLTEDGEVYRIRRHGRDRVRRVHRTGSSNGRAGCGARSITSQCRTGLESESAKPLMSRMVACQTSGMASRNRQSPLWQVPLTVRLIALTPASSSVRK